MSNINASPGSPTNPIDVDAISKSTSQTVCPREGHENCDWGHPDVCMSCHRLGHDFTDCPIKLTEIPPLPIPGPSSSHQQVIEHPAPPERTIVTCEKCVRTGHTKEECIFSGPIICSYCGGMGHPKPKCRFILDRRFTQRFTSQEQLALHAKREGKVWNAKEYMRG